MTIPLAVLIAIGLLGASLLVRGLRGRRVGDHLHCRRCGFDLFGLPADHARCPECGADLWRPRATITGVRRRRPLMLFIGLTMLLLAVSVGSLWTITRAGKIDWYRHEPVWLLARQATANDPSWRSPVLVELRVRLASGQLSSVQVGAIADRILKLQSDPRTLWDTRWGDFLEAAQTAVLLDESRWTRYAAQALEPQITVRPRVRWDDPIPLVLSCASPRAASRTRLHISVRVDSIQMFGERFMPPLLALEPSGSPQAAAITLQTVAGSDIRGTLGPQSLQAHVVTRILCDTDASGRHGSFISESAKIHQATVDMLPSSQSSLEELDDPAVGQRLVKSISVVAEPRGRRLLLAVRVREVPVPICCDLVVRASASEIVLNGVTVICNSGESREFEFDCFDPGVRWSEPFDIILRPSRRSAVAMVDVRRMWGRDILISDVGIQRRK